jgi:hypothetical protein
LFLSLSLAAPVSIPAIMEPMAPLIMPLQIRGLFIAIRFIARTARRIMAASLARGIDCMTDLRPRLNPNSAKYREQLWDACANPTTGFVHCNLCGGRVFAGEAWAESHIGVPAALGGNTVGIAHKRCNELDNNTFVTPFVAKTKRMRRKHVGADTPGLGKKSFSANRDKPMMKKLNGEVVRRPARGEKHRALMTKLYGEQA